VSASIFRVVYDVVAARGNKHQFGQPLVQWPCWHLFLGQANEFPANRENNREFSTPVMAFHSSLLDIQ